MPSPAIAVALADSNTVSGQVTFSNVNDAPVLNSVAFSVSEGNAAVLSAANIDLTDVVPAPVLSTALALSV